MTRTSTKVLLAAGSALLGFVASEAYCRVLVAQENEALLQAALREPVPIQKDATLTLKHIIRVNPNPKIIYELKPGIRDVEYLDAPLSTNSLGFRGPEVAQPKPKGTIRILGIGDSVMFGQGVSDADTYLRRMEAELNSRFPEHDWELVNSGVPGYNAVLEVETLEEKGLPLDIDGVFLGLVQNDFEMPNFTQERRDPWTTSRLYLPDYVLHRAAGGAAGERNESALKGRDMTGGREALVDPDSQPEHLRSLVGEEAFREAIERLAELSRLHDLPVLAFSYKYSRNCTRMLEICEEVGIEAISTHRLLEEYREEHGLSKTEDYNHSDLVVGPQDHHPSAKLHGLLAEWVLDELGGAEWFARVATESR